MASARFRLDIPQKALAGLDLEIRRQLGPVARELGQELIDKAQEYTRERLVNDRPEDRRNAGKGLPHYLDSFTLGAPDLSGGRVRVLVRNTHPGAKPIEEGTPGHEIPGPGSFPFASTTRGGKQYATPHKTKPTVKYGARNKTVDHQGTPPQKIVTDATKWVKENIRDVTVRIQVALKR